MFPKVKLTETSISEGEANQLIYRGACPRGICYTAYEKKNVYKYK